MNIIDMYPDRISPEPNSGCWLWEGAQLPTGYGALNRHGKYHLAHRFSYQLSKGEIPVGLQLDHKCRQPSCVNPDHLEAVTSAENTRRGRHREATIARHKAKLVCKRGHDLRPGSENVAFMAMGKDRQYMARRCRECSKLKTRARRARGL